MRRATLYTESPSHFHEEALILLKCAVLCTGACAQVIPYFEGKLDCDTAYTNLELGLCSRYHLDSATSEMNALVSGFSLRIDSALEGAISELKDGADTSLTHLIRDDAARLRTMRMELLASQQTFLAYAANVREVVGQMVGTGRERTIQENYAELELVIARIELLKQWLEFY